MIGIMVFDDDAKATLEQKIQRAADAYWRRTGKTATICQIHPSQFNPQVNMAGIKIEAVKHMRYNHFLAGEVAA